RVIDGVAGRDLVLLGGEAVLPELLSLGVALGQRFNGFEPADRVGLLDELTGAQRHQAEELPPGRLVLAPVPAQQLREEPAGLLLRRSLCRIWRDIGCE